MNPKWTTQQIGWLALTLVSSVMSLFVYLPSFIKSLKNAGKICTLKGDASILYSLAEPKNWFGIFTLLLVVLLMRKGYALISSKHANAEHFKWLVGGFVLVILLGWLTYGCK